MRINTIALLMLGILSGSGVLAELPVLHFNGKVIAEEEVQQELCGAYGGYVSYQEDESLPSEMLNLYSKENDFSLCLYHDERSVQEAPFSLNNSRLLETLLFQGYWIKAYGWVLGEENKPLRGLLYTLVGYNHYKQVFHARVNGQEVELSYKDAKANLRFASLVGGKDAHRWHFTQVENDFFTNAHLVHANGLEQALSKVSAKKGVSLRELSETQWMLNVLPEKVDHRNEKRIQIPFRMEIKKKKLKSSGCGGFIWWPVGAKTWHTFRWDEEKYGTFLYFDPTKPVDYPDGKSRNYVHNKHWSCHPCGKSTMVPGVWIRHKYDGNLLEVRIVKRSTCNIGTAHWDEYGNATGVVTGIINCWVLTR